MGRYLAGRRRSDDTLPQDLEPGDYCRRRGAWWVCCPGEYGGGGRLDGRWAVTEHSEGVITVTPSIRLKAGEATIYHGYLTNGVWAAC